EFDSSYSRGKPFQCVIGSRRVIQGWDLGLIGMQVGGKRKLWVPAHLGYGERQVGAIPANANLIFEIELLEVLTRDD
ncbi:MAG TPA: FKBP-type peptidyl-prolyl cis-trans isomerase, partial [Pseudomonas sp.]|nr:FKBP-type peptidyl-prolyl cis-trans isomerase [Pseudomonas sp.]